MDIEQACNRSRRNRQAVTAAKECGCYFCLRSFPAAEVVEWADMADTTALCPNCGIDSVLPGVTDIETLAAANERWFCETPAALSPEASLERRVESGAQED